MATFTWAEKPPIVLVGPTASGKTAAAVALAERIGAEIINVDSMQIYQGMEIGTAKPTPDERKRARFHLLDLVPPDTPFSVAEWKERAENAITEITSRGKRVLICGGTGLYIKALLEDWSLAETPAHPEVRERLRQELETLGANTLHQRLETIDVITAQRLHPNDGVRIVRALEVYETTGQPISKLQAQDKQTQTTRPALKFGLTLPREELYQRIEARVDAMIAAGLETEVRSLWAQGYNPAFSPLRSLGYKEMSAFLNGESDLPTTIQAIKQSTRRYAKRQLTWFRADTHIVWFNVSGQSSEEIATLLEEAIQTVPPLPPVEERAKA